MIFTVKENEKVFCFGFARVNQWCGHNIVLKNKLIRHITKYFSNSKYLTDEDEIRVFIEGEEVGRKYFNTIWIRNREDLISIIRNSKTGLLMKIVKERLNEFQYQDALERIDNELMRIFDELENRLFCNISNIMLNYERADLFDIIQSSEALSEKGKPLETMEEKELINTFLGLLEEYQSCIPEKVLIVFENIDHIMTVQDYKEVLEKCRKLSTTSESYFICSSSINRYVKINNELCEGITVFNDLIYTVPDYEHLLDYIRENYPYVTTLSDEQICEMLEDIIHGVGKSDDIVQLESEVIRKIINKTMAISNRMRKGVNPLIIPFLMQ